MTLHHYVNYFNQWYYCCRVAKCNMPGEKKRLQVGLNSKLHCEPNHRWAVPYCLPYPDWFQSRLISIHPKIYPLNSANRHLYRLPSPTSGLTWTDLSEKRITPSCEGSSGKSILGTRTGKKAKYKREGRKILLGNRGSSLETRQTRWDCTKSGR